MKTIHSIRSPYLQRALAALCSMLLAAGCQTGLPERDESEPVLSSHAPPYSGYSELTRQETEETLRRLQKIRKALQDKGQIAYRGPIRHIWDRIHANYQIRYEDNLRIEEQATVLLRDRKYLNRVSHRAQPYAYFIVQEIERRKLPGELALLPVIESAFRPTAVSRSRAVGLWQFIPSTARFLKMQNDWWYDARRDVITSTRKALDYLQGLNQRFEGDWLLAIASYNGGHGTVQKAIDRNRRAGRPTDFWSLRLPEETMNYVPRFLAASRIFTNPGAYEVRLKPVANRPYFQKVNLDGQIALKKAADMADISLSELKRLNPGFLRSTTPPNGPHHLLLPVNRVKDFYQQLSATPTSEQVSWDDYEVQVGDTLTSIALRHGTSVSVLKKRNGLHNAMIRKGQVLRVPAASTSTAELAQGGKARTGGIATDPIIHVVRQGDTLWGIAKRYKLSLQTLASLNDLGVDSVIKPGQRLIVGPVQT